VLIASRGKRAVVTRLWQLVLVLHRARQPCSIARLMGELGVSRPTLYRDLDQLEQAGVALERTTVNGEARVALIGLRTLAVAPAPRQIAAGAPGSGELPIPAARCGDPFGRGRARPARQ
jgi:biotin operon repressor